jgi:hypothetical protein
MATDELWVSVAHSTRLQGKGSRVNHESVNDLYWKIQIPVPSL